ncbi:MAG: YdjY domain-containing protein [Pirellulaceae bacterium]
MRQSTQLFSFSLAAILVVSLVVVAHGQEPKPEKKPGEGEKEKAATIGTDQMLRVSKDHSIWIDLKRRWVVVDGWVCLREGELEMFACTVGTKEHESVITLKTKSRLVHASLLAVGAKIGNTVKFSPEYKAASGTVIDIIVLWKDKDEKKHAVPGQQWVKHHRNGKPLEHPWVFAGSGFFKDELSMSEIYYGDGGDLICVSNFSSATMDLPVQSSKDNNDLLYQARTASIPPIQTSVRMVMIPRLKEKLPEGKIASAMDAKSPLLKEVLRLEPPEDEPDPEEKPAEPKKPDEPKDPTKTPTPGS